MSLIKQRRAALLGVACAATLAVTGLSAAPLSAAPGWWEDAQVGVTVHEHAFRRVSVNGTGCTLRVRLHFEAPEARYAEPAPERNHYYFRAQLQLADGKSIESEVFDNRSPGARVFAFSHDTSDEGCWAEARRALRKLDVQACRGDGCVPRAFE